MAHNNSSIILVTEGGSTGDVIAPVLGGLIVFLLLLLGVQCIRSEKMRQESTKNGSMIQTDTSHYKRASWHEGGFIRPGEDGFVKAEEGRAGEQQTLSESLKAENWMLRTEFLSQQWSIKSEDIDWVYDDECTDEDGVHVPQKKVIGEGSFGKIYLGEYQGLKCAVKEIKINHEADDEEVQGIQERFLLDPNILNTMGGMWEGAGPDAKNLIVSEYCHLGNLKDTLKRIGHNIFWTPSTIPMSALNGKSGGKQTLRSSAGISTHKLDWARQISLGLTYLHGRKPAIIHRDLKCANILVDTGFIMKITDFGESRHKAQGEMTMTGTAYFMAPEVFAGNGRYDEKCDVYSFAMLLLEIHNGNISAFFNNKKAGKKKTGGQIMHKAAEGWRPNLEHVRRPVLSAEEKKKLLEDSSGTFKRSNTGRRECDDHLYMPDPLIDLIKRMWNHTPSKRPTMAEVSEFLKKCCSGDIEFE
eukprot:CAMPEP_0118669454 /NCGR_PEP_ID=MMETSP0785-20121206/20915_1 /TAXON_ID=91992 /ORGANISM="Bolidomonas pacifica, Strain CCMP 1866" /LENGTH=470 /DNA_ID=CAMNT_0006564149 /DNA_START=77 /DNA_END=1489 /DNA_ORIENTATION=+